MGGGQDKPAWTACPPGVKITRAGGKISRDSLPPGGQANRTSCPGAKINWDTGVYNVRLLIILERGCSSMYRKKESCLDNGFSCSPGTGGILSGKDTDLQRN